MSVDEILVGLTGLAAVAVLPFLIVWLFVAFVGASAASARGRGSVSWFFVALALGPFALILLAMFPIDKDALEARQVRELRKARCPFCLMAIPLEATKCFHCHSTISPRAHSRLQLELRKAEEVETPRDGKRGTTQEKETVDKDVISQAIHMCLGGVPRRQAAAHFGVTEEDVKSWIDRYKDDDGWMQDIDMAAQEKPK